MDLESGVQTFKLDRSGMARWFGELEAGILEALWTMGEGTVATVSAQMEAPQQYTTIQTVLNRLVDKGVLRRTGKIGGAYVYQPVEDRATFLAHASREVVASLLQDFGQASVVGLVDAVGSARPEQLDALEALIRARREAAS